MLKGDLFSWRGTACLAEYAVSVRCPLPTFGCVFCLMILMLSSAARGAVLAEYTYDDFPHGTSNPSAPNVAGVDGVFVSSISRTPGDEGDGNGLGTIAVTRTLDATNVSFSSTALVIGLGTTGRNPFADPPQPLLPSQDWLTFTLINQTSQLRLTSFSFEYGVSVSTNDRTGVMSAVQLFYSLNAQPFVAVGEIQHRIIPSGSQGYFIGFLPSEIDLLSMPLLGENDSIEFRLVFGDNSSVQTSSKGAYIDNLVLRGSVIPEPAGLGLSGIVGVALMRRRARSHDSCYAQSIHVLSA